MNQLRILVFSLAVIVGDMVSVQSSDKIIIINGYFFNELPAAVKHSAVKSEMKMFFIETANGVKAIGMYLPSLELSEEALKYSRPVEQIREGEELLRRYNEQKQADAGYELTVASSEPLIKVGDKFPQFSATDISGRTWTNADVCGKVMVLNLWFTGCGPCRAEMPELSAWKDEMPDVMFFSSTYEAPEIARQVLDKIRFNWIPLVGDVQFKEFIGRNGYPLTIVVDKSGYIAAYEYGTSPEQRAALKAKIASLRLL